MYQVTLSTHILTILLTFLTIPNLILASSTSKEAVDTALVQTSTEMRDAGNHPTEDDTGLIPDERVSALSYPALPGFPAKVPEGIIHAVSPTVADLDNNGTKEIVVANNKGIVYIFSSKGVLQRKIKTTKNRVIQAHLALGDLDQDGDLEIVAGVSTAKNGVPGAVYVWHHTGSVFSGWPQEVDRYGTAKPSLINSVVLADVDGDRDLEIIAGTNNNILHTSKQNTGFDVPDLYVWHHNGALLNGKWPVKDGPGIKGHIAAADLNGDAKTDILTGRDYTWLFAYDRRGNALPGWPVQTFVPPNGSNKNNDAQIVHKTSGPVVADLKGDGNYEYIVAGLRTPHNSDRRLNNDLLVLRPTGDRYQNWRRPASGSGVLSSDVDMFQTPAIGDLNNDSHLDIVVPTQDGKIRAYTHKKSLLWEFDYSSNKLIYASEPVIGDVDGDGLNEILFSTYDPRGGKKGPTGVWVLEHDGTVKGKKPLVVDDPGVRAAPTLTDLNNDGKLDIIAISRRGTLYVWNTKKPYNTDLLPWPVARHDQRRTGFFDAESFNARKAALPAAGEQGEILSLNLYMVNSGNFSTNSPIKITDVVPPGLSYVPNSLTATHGNPDDSQAPMLRWTGNFPETGLVEINYKVQVTESEPTVVVASTTTIESETTGKITRSTLVIANPLKQFFPLIFK